VADQDQDKSEEATPHKLEEAKRRGQVAKSLDFNSFLLLAGMLALFYAWGRNTVGDGLRLEQSIFAQAQSFAYDAQAILPWMGQLLVETGILLAPVFLTAIIVALLSNLFQTGPIFSFFPLKPDVQRLNPVQGFKKIFSTRLLFEGLKSTLKLALFGAVAYFMIAAALPSIIGMVQQDPRGYVWTLFDQIATLVFKLLLVVMLVAILDLVYTRWDFGKKMRMSKREMKEEVKRREGDPQVRAKIRQLQREAAKRAKSVSSVPDADVLITNPTHLAIALRYDRERMPAPQVIAKGAGELALAMRKKAVEHGVVIMERRPLARQLFRDVAIDQIVPEALYEPIAHVYAELYKKPRQGDVTVGVRL
jgi:flagellar biosynthetic protein FlhB